MVLIRHNEKEPRPGANTGTAGCGMGEGV